MKSAPVPADALLAVEHGPGRRDANRDRDDRHHRQRQEQPDRRHEHIERALGPRERPALPESFGEIIQLGRRFSTAILPVYSSYTEAR